MRADVQRNREAILDAAGLLLAARGNAVQMDEIANRCGLGMGTLYRHFPTKQTLVVAIVARRIGIMTTIAADAATQPDAQAAFDMLLHGYLASAATDAAYRWSVLGPDPINWDELADAKQKFKRIANAIIKRAVEANYLRSDFDFRDFVRLTRAVMANMSANTTSNWKRTLSLFENGIIGNANHSKIGHS